MDSGSEARPAENGGDNTVRVNYRVGPGNIKVDWTHGELDRLIMSEKHRVKILCHRCEHRARFFETGAMRRPACGDEMAETVHCQAYLPTKPLHTKKGKALRLPFAALTRADYKNNTILFWIPAEQ